MVLDFILKPECPRFPDASLRVGKMAGWFYNFTAWLGLRLGLLGRPFLALSSRARSVEWARTPLHQRMMVGVGVGIVGGLLLFCGGLGGSRTVGPPGRIS